MTDDTADDGKPSQSGSDGKQQRSESGDDSGSDSSDTSPYEKGVTALSVIVTLLIFSTVVWQAVNSPDDQGPTVEVVETALYGNDSVSVTVVVTNPSSTGLEAVSVSVDCTDPPIELTYQHLPAGDRRSKYAVCPNWNQSTNVSIESWTVT